MNRKFLLISSITMIVTLLFTVAYLSFNALDITRSRLKMYQITIATESMTKVYDGTELTHQVWFIESGGLAEDDDILVVMPSKIKDVGTVKNEIGITIFDKNFLNVTHHYQITYKLGDLTIEGIPLTIQSKSAEKDYDGEPLVFQEWFIQQGVLKENHTITYQMPSEITRPGTVTNDIWITIVDNFNVDVTRNYEIDYHLGTLTVYGIPLIIKSESAIKVYDGEPFMESEWQLLHGQLLDGHQLFAIVDGEVTNIGSVENTIFAYVLDELGRNVSHFYEFYYFPGTLTVLTSAYGSGELSREGFEPSDEEVFKFIANDSGLFYFRDRSWGDYNKKGWDDGVPHNVAITVNPMVLSGYALLESGLLSNALHMEYLRDYVPYLWPYHSVDVVSHLGDVHIPGSTNGIITHQNIFYHYTSDENIALQNSLWMEQEQLYRSYVYQHYLTMPESTRLAMLNIASENNIYASSPTLIDDIKTYITQAATYNLMFERIPDDVDDIALYFLTVSKEGICQHYATAGVLMYRSMGIPSRYVTGYLGPSLSDEWVTVTGKYAHAWVEIYLDGFGWMPIEVTGGGPGSGSGDGDNGDNGNGGDNGDNGDNGDGGDGGDNGDNGDGGLIEITITPRNIREPYEPGKTIQPFTAQVSGFGLYAVQGYTYQVTFEGELDAPGQTTSRIGSVTIYDAFGADVTELFKITRKEGILQLYLYEIQLETEGIQKIYDGQYLRHEQWQLHGSLEEGHYIQDISFHGEQMYVGTSRNRATLTIYDEEGQNVTSLYYVENIFGELDVQPRHLKITTSSATKPFDGTALKNSNFEIVEGSLVDGQQIEILITGTQTSIGSSMNTLSELSISDGGLDVTLNYSIEIVEGILNVTPN